jgi:hypothetical protein
VERCGNRAQRSAEAGGVRHFLFRDPPFPWTRWSPTPG